MTAPFLLLAAGIASQACKYCAVFSGDDYPRHAYERGEQGSVEVQILISPVGQVDTCTVLQSTGHADLDQSTCAIIQTRAKFVPAKDKDGRSVFSVDRVPVTWALDQTPRVTVNPDFDLTIDHGPPGVSFPLEFEVSYFVTSAGTVTKCEASDAGSPQELVDLACKVVMSTPFDAFRDHNGVPVTALDYAKVKFRIKH